LGAIGTTRRRTHSESRVRIEATPGPQRHVHQAINTGTSTNGPMTAANAAPLWMPKLSPTAMGIEVVSMLRR
jgi:hypothetical protein